MNQTYTSDEIKEILLYVKELQEREETQRAQLTALMAKLANEEAKVRQLKHLLYEKMDTDYSA